jgi:hypothetical protein
MENTPTVEPDSTGRDHGRHTGGLFPCWWPRVSGAAIDTYIEVMRSMISSRIRAVGLLGAGAALALGGCSSDDEPAAEGPTTATTLTTAPGPQSTSADAEQRFPDVIDVVVEEESAGVFAFAVTISSPYDTPDRYADGWRIIGPDGTVYGEHTLTHDHANEQPFTRIQRGVEIPPDLSEVIVEGRDLEHGYGGGTVTVTIGR